MMHHQQPSGSKTCGQHCVAILAGVPVDRAMEAIGKGRRPTTEKDLLRGLAAFGLALGVFVRRPLHLRGVPRIAGLALGRVRFEGRRYGYHWVAFNGPRVHDPGGRRSVTAAAYARWLRRRRGRIASFAPVETAA